MLQILREHKKVLGWTITDIQGISPSIYTHKILMEETYKPKVQPRKRLNLNMKEVVKLKLLNFLMQVLSTLYLIVHG